MLDSLNNRNLFLTLLEARKVNINVSADLVFAWELSPCLPGRMCIYGERDLSFSPYIATNLRWRAHPMTFYNFNYLLKSYVQIQSHLGLVFEYMNLVEHHSAHSRAHTDFCYHQTISKKILSGSQRNSWKTYVVYHNNNFRRSYILFFYHKSNKTDFVIFR